MIYLYGHPGSTCTRKVLTTLAETSTPFELSLVDLAKGEHKQEPHLTRQPFGQIPTIDDGGFKLFESRAICRYLNDKAGSPLTPKDVMERAVMDQWLSVEQSNFSSAAMKLIFHYIFKRPQEDAVLDSAGKMIDTTLAALSTPLERTSYIAGEQFTLADIGYMPYVEYALNTPAKAVFEKYPRVMTWWGRVSARPSWQKVSGRG